MQLVKTNDAHQRVVSVTHYVEDVSGSVGVCVPLLGFQLIVY